MQAFVALKMGNRTEPGALKVWDGSMVVIEEGNEKRVDGNWAPAWKTSHLQSPHSSIHL